MWLVPRSAKGLYCTGEGRGGVYRVKSWACRGNRTHRVARDCVMWRARAGTPDLNAA